MRTQSVTYTWPWMDQNDLLYVIIYTHYIIRIFIPKVFLKSEWVVNSLLHCTCFNNLSVYQGTGMNAVFVVATLTESNIAIGTAGALISSISNWNREWEHKCAKVLYILLESILRIHFSDLSNIFVIPLICFVIYRDGCARTMISNAFKHLIIVVCETLSRVSVG